MMHFLLTVGILITGWTCTSDQYEKQKMVTMMSLPDGLKECSGMASLGNGWFVANNDSGNPAELYLFKLAKNPDTKTVKLENAKNIDWEDLAEDEKYIYVGDFGNNSGKRKDLRIYRVSKADLRKEREVKAELINFNFPEQTDFNGSGQTNFDCEAMVTIGDSLYLFTKNHGNLKTDLYSLPKEPGIYSARRLGEFDSAGLITGADYRNSGDGGIGELVLVGYTDKLHGYQPFIIYFKDVEPNDLFNAPFVRLEFRSQLQVESILFDTPKAVFLTSEGKRKDDRNVYSVTLSN